MAKRGDIVDQKTRDSIPGSGLGRVVNREAWGADKAVQRYGGGLKIHQPPPDQSGPQFRQDQCADKTHNDTPNNWLRGSNSDATTRPGYVPGFRSTPSNPGYQGARCVDEQSGPPLRKPTPRGSR